MTPQSPTRPRPPGIEVPKMHEAIAKIASALEPFGQEEQKRLLKAACVLCKLDADITEQAPA